MGISGEGLRDASAERIRELNDAGELSRALEAGTAVVYKHSPACWLSAMAWRHIRRFSKRHPDIPIYMINVFDQRQLSDEVESRFGIRHESPQVIVTRDGEVVWHASHMRVTSVALEEHTEAA